jgi:transcriptional regulator with XRE-family HTH domain
MDWVDRLRQAVDAKGKHSAVAMDAGVDPSSLSDILRRETDNPKLQTLIRVCAVCGVTVGWLLGEQGFELGQSDFEFLSEITGWINSKRLDLISLSERGAEPSAPPLAHEARFAKIPLAAATPRETFVDEDEIRERAIPHEYQIDGANAVYRTRGDSMIDAGILDGDILFVRRTRNRTAANGHVVVGRLDGTFTVKRLHVEKDAITLTSESHGRHTITINEEAERFALIGIVVGLARDLLRR